MSINDIPSIWSIVYVANEVRRPFSCIIHVLITLDYSIRSELYAPVLQRQHLRPDGDSQTIFIRTYFLTYLRGNGIPYRPTFCLIVIFYCRNKFRKQKFRQDIAIVRQMKHIYHAVWY